MNTNSLGLQKNGAPPAAWIGWDWADQHHDLFLEGADGQTEQVHLANRPAELHTWLKQLGQRFGQRKIALCLEATRRAWLPILLEYSFWEIYPVNPKSRARFREVVRPGGSKNDLLAGRLAGQLVKSHAALLHPWVAEDPATIELEQWVRYRRALVDQRAGLANQLASQLKFYYPLAWELVGHDTPTGLAANFVLEFPTLKALQAAGPAKARKFFLGQGSHRTAGLEARLEMIAPAQPVSPRAEWNNPASFMACALARQLKALSASIDALEERIRILAEQQANHALAKSVPGAGAAMEPRLMVALGPHPEACPSAAALAVRSGVAPLRRQSGNACLTVRRWAKPQFLHQTWLEYAKSSTLWCGWAKEFVDAKIKAGKTYFTAIRALAYKWTRILYACWQNGTEYDEIKYLAALKKHQSPFQPKTEAQA